MTSIPKDSPSTDANSRQVGGDHYKTGGEEHWDRVNRLGLDYFQGQITKYVERWKKKGGVQDLKKARHFLDKYIELNELNEPNKDAEPGPGYVCQDPDIAKGVGGVKLGPFEEMRVRVDPNIVWEGNLPPPRPRPAPKTPFSPD